jgi:hypothetical protein
VFIALFYILTDSFSFTAIYSNASHGPFFVRGVVISSTGRVSQTGGRKTESVAGKSNGENPASFRRSPGDPG